MSKTIYLHIGVNKTGTSAIQNYFNINRRILLANGVLYPCTGVRGDAHYELSDLLGFKQTARLPVAPASQALLDMTAVLRREIAAHSAQAVVVSSEFFVLPKSVEPVKRFFEGFDVKVVVYLRRHDKWWPSAFNQAIRTVVNPPWKRGFGSFIKFHEKLGPCPSKAAYRLLLDRWAAVFGKENIIVRPYEAQQNQPHIIADFLSAIGYGHLTNKLPPLERRVNDSIDSNTLAFIDMLQRAGIDQDLRKKMVKYVLKSQKIKGESMSLDPVILHELVKKNLDDYKYIATEYLGRLDGELFYDPLPEPSVLWHKVKQPTAEEITEQIVNFFEQK